jgi:hypothetical protein
VRHIDLARGTAGDRLPVGLIHLEGPANVLHRIRLVVTSGRVPLEAFVRLAPAAADGSG